MKVKEFYKYIKAPLKIISGFNGKVLCRNYQPRLHDEKFGDVEYNSYKISLEG